MRTRRDWQFFNWLKNRSWPREWRFNIDHRVWCLFLIVRCQTGACIRSCRASFPRSLEKIICHCFTYVFHNFLVRQNASTGLLGRELTDVFYLFRVQSCKNISGVIHNLTLLSIHTLLPLPGWVVLGLLCLAQLFLLARLRGRHWLLATWVRFDFIRCTRIWWFMSAMHQIFISLVGCYSRGWGNSLCTCSLHSFNYLLAGAFSG